MFLKEQWTLLYYYYNSGAGPIHSSAQLVIFAIVKFSHFPLDNAAWRVVLYDKDYMVALIIAREMLVYHSQFQWPGKCLFKATCNEDKPELHPYVFHESSFCLWAVLTTTLTFLYLSKKQENLMSCGHTGWQHQTWYVVFQLHHEMQILLIHRHISVKVKKGKGAPLYRHWGSVQAVWPIGGVEV